MPRRSGLVGPVLGDGHAVLEAILRRAQHRRRICKALVRLQRREDPAARLQAEPRAPVHESLKHNQPHFRRPNGGAMGQTSDESGVAEGGWAQRLRVTTTSGCAAHWAAGRSARGWERAGGSTTSSRPCSPLY
jgi:hypothetical protein